jgi:hypothetical protein
MHRLPPHKTGDTINWGAALTDDAGVAISLTGYAVAAQIRDPEGALIAALVYTPDADQVGAGKGRYALSYPGSTQNFPLGNHRCDIEYSYSGTVISTETFIVPIVDDITQ